MIWLFRDDSDEEVLLARCHYTQAEVDGCIFNLNDYACVKVRFCFLYLFVCEDIDNAEAYLICEGFKTQANLMNTTEKIPVFGPEIHGIICLARKNDTH
uniref:Uncharacterized protein n=1 Tax=Nelumbo nucifera TaxID=4432 RepID=A0A822ZCB1_NELNU|nr:TPA_asm: hypothetical protein HUJ06_000390 [Nelumbo nucifera]